MSSNVLLQIETTAIKNLFLDEVIDKIRKKYTLWMPISFKKKPSHIQYRIEASKDILTHIRKDKKQFIKFDRKRLILIEKDQFFSLPIRLYEEQLFNAIFPFNLQDENGKPYIIKVFSLDRKILYKFTLHIRINTQGFETILKSESKTLSISYDNGKLSTKIDDKKLNVDDLEMHIDVQQIKKVVYYLHQDLVGKEYSETYLLEQIDDEYQIIYIMDETPFCHHFIPKKVMLNYMLISSRDEISSHLCPLCIKETE